MNWTAFWLTIGAIFVVYCLIAVVASRWSERKQQTAYDIGQTIAGAFVLAAWMAVGAGVLIVLAKVCGL